ncbi:MAG: ParB/RepB/Spo0J family partition protein [Thermomicrobiales bacterium]
MTDDAEDQKQNVRTRTRRGGLGRGLDALIPTSRPEDPAAAVPPAVATGEPLQIGIDEITANPYQPRTHMDRHRLEELAESIRLHGIMQPLIVTRRDEEGRYILIAGERRWRASRLAGLTTVPVIVKHAVPQAMLELALVENVVRADLSPLEEAVAYKQLMEEFGLSQGTIAERVGRSRVAISNTMRLLNAPDRIRAALAGNQITEGHARALLGLPNATDQLAALDLVIERGLNVRQTEDLVRRWGLDAAKEKEAAERTRPPEDAQFEEQLRTALGTRVSFRRGAQGKGGTVTIQYFSDEQLQSLYDRLVGEDQW